MIYQEWHCPNCGLTDRTNRFLPNRFHTCPKLHGLTAPLLLRGTRAKVEARLRDDYVGGELVQKADDGKPYMSVVTTRDNGQDVTVFAPVASARLEVN